MYINLVTVYDSANKYIQLDNVNHLKNLKNSFVLTYHVTYLTCNLNCFDAVTCLLSYWTAYQLVKTYIGEGLKSFCYFQYNLFLLTFKRIYLSNQRKQ
jgi:hypothetical protein